MPVSLVGQVADKQPSPTTPLTTPTPPTTVDPQQLLAQARAAAASSNGSPLYDEMVALAKSSPDYPTFLTAALGNPDVLADDELAQRVADEGGIWATAHS